MNYNRLLRFVLLFLILVNVSYLRGIQIGSGITSSYLIILFGGITTVIICFSFFQQTSFLLLRRWWVWLGLATWIVASFFFNVLVYPYPKFAIRFTAEMLLNFILFFSFVYFLDKQLLKNIYQKFLVVSASMGAVLMFYPLYTGDESVRRVGGYELPGAVNNISMMIGVGVVIAVVGIVYKESWRKSKVELITIPPLLVGLFLSGSRAAMIGVVIGVGLLVVLADFNYSRVFAGIGGIAFVMLLVLESLYNLTGLYRFTLTGLSVGVNNRLRVYQQAVVDSGTNLESILFGGGMHRYQKFGLENGDLYVQPIIYPHNYVISLLVHIGFIGAVLFSIALVWNYRMLLNQAAKKWYKLDYLTTTTLLSLIVITMYSFTSGRVTRTYPLWIFLGISEFLYASDILDLERTERISLYSNSKHSDE